MRIDESSLAFGYTANGAGNPNWSIALGQSHPSYKINLAQNPGLEDILVGMTYCAIPISNVTTKMGKGGRLVSGNDIDTPIVEAALFSKVFVNDVAINNGKFILLIDKDQSPSHRGRLRLRYSKHNSYTDGSIVYNNEDFYKLVYNTFSLNDDACWFVYDISVRHQDELHMRAVFVDKTASVNYTDSATLHAEWKKLVDTAAVSPSSNPSIDDLAAVLETMYNNPAASGKAMTPMIFGFQYADIIEKNKYSLSAIVSKTTVPDSYEVEIKKGMNTYKAIKSGEYGLGFSLGDNDEAVGSDGESNTPTVTLTYNTEVTSSYSHNRIIFGAPGTGKSYTLNKEMRTLVPNEESFERVTFHPDYSYANFVGTYKPVPKGDEITYSFVAGPFIRTWIKAMKSAQNYVAQPYVLLIEEINRANVAAVFGDVFQLLDRDENGVSEYSIQTSKELREYLASELGCSLEAVTSIRIPNNMFIWATMNSADQGVFPMDTAFKRRWDFKYLGIDDSQDGIKHYELSIAGQNINWNKLRQAINNRLSALNINEDKLIGPYFINEKTLKDNKAFVEAFKSKVIMYLFEDAAKQRRGKVFYQEGVKYSDLCQRFMSEGIKVFNPEICKNLIDTEEA